MTEAPLQVDFYVLPENAKGELFACSLIQKAWSAGNNVFINMESDADAEKMNDLLWTYKDISFLPHCLANDKQADQTPIVIGRLDSMGGEQPAHTSVMLNFAQDIPQRSATLKRVLEIVAGDENQRQQARKKYADYRQQGHALNKHDIETHGR